MIKRNIVLICFMFIFFSNFSFANSKKNKKLIFNGLTYLNENKPEVFWDIDKIVIGETNGDKFQDIIVGGVKDNRFYLIKRGHTLKFDIKK